MSGLAIGDWCWHMRQSSPCRVIDRQDDQTIIAVAKKIPDEALQEDEKLLLWYDQALTRMEER